MSIALSVIYVPLPLTRLLLDTYFILFFPVQELEESLLMSEESFKEKYGFPRLDPYDENLVITCRSGRRVGIANDILKAKGFTKHR